MVRGLHRDKRVADTKYGKGLYANKDFSSCEIIESYKFQILEDGVDVLKSHALYDYFFKSPEGNLNIVFGDAIFLNHSEAPNCKLVWIDVLGEVGLFPIRDIDFGEELTIYYGNADEYGDLLEPNL